MLTCLVNSLQHITVLQVSSIRAAFAAFDAHQAKLSEGKFSVDHSIEVLRALETPKFAPNGRDFAVMVAVSPEACINKLEERNVALQYAYYCSIVVVSEGEYCRAKRASFGACPS